MSMVEKQQKFALAVSVLIQKAAEVGLPVTFGDAFRDDRLHGKMGVKKGYGEANSCHKLRLAVDLNIIKDGDFAPESDYARLHDIWDTLGGSQRILKDLNHFSFEHNGFR